MAAVDSGFFSGVAILNEVEFVTLVEGRMLPFDAPETSKIFVIDLQIYLSFESNHKDIDIFIL